MSTEYLFTLRAQHDAIIRGFAKARRRLAVAVDDFAAWEKHEAEVARSLNSEGPHVHAVRELAAAKRRLKSAQEEVDEWDRAEDRAARDVEAEARRTVEETTAALNALQQKQSSEGDR